MSFLEEVASEPHHLRRLLERFAGERKGRLQLAAKLIRSSRSVTFVGMGSSEYAMQPARLLLAQHGFDARSEEAGEALHYALPGLIGRGPVVAVSQSGESAETVRVAQQLSGQVPLIAIVNDPNSSLARKADVLLPMDVGPEAGTSNKTFAASVAIGLLLAGVAVSQPDAAARAAVFQGPQPMERREGFDAAAAISAATSAIEALQAAQARFGPEAAGIARWLAPARYMTVVARGYALAAARQAALILKEMTGRPVEALPAGSFRHGPIEISGPDHACIILTAGDHTHPLLAKLAADISRLGSRVWLVGAGGGAIVEGAAAADAADPAPSDRLRQSTIEGSERLGPWSVLPLMAPLELVAAELARLDGREPGVLLRTAKVTATE